ncbi:MAG: pseudouridine synthase [Rikenellaceae bacterium]
MKDFKQDSSAHLSRFGRDKRDRGSKPTFEERRPRSQRDAADSEQKPARRASYNPNFTADNRPKGNFQKADGEDFGRKPYDGERKSFDKKPYGERKSFDKKPFGERKSFDKKPYGERKSFDKKPYGERKSFDKKPYEERGGEFEKRGYGDGGKDFANKSKNAFRPRSKGDKPQGSYPRYNPNTQTGEIRLNRFLAQSGVCSRREADDYIAAGVVTVNGVIVTELGSKVQMTDEVKFNDTRLQGEKRVYLVLNKPKGYVTTLDDPHADKTVMDLVRNACSERIYPVGRLDKNSLGLLLFTNDGDLTKQLTHPSHNKKKIYQVTLDKPLTRADMDSIAHGIKLEDGEIYADEISYIKDSKDEVGIEIHSGRNRIVRRIFEHFGYTVQKLDRVYFSGLTKKNLKRGEWRFLTDVEVDRLKSGRYE